jgi:hypothetical protein
MSNLPIPLWIFIAPAAALMLVMGLLIWQHCAIRSDSRKRRRRSTGLA